jgi:hypothetical protein
LVDFGEKIAKTSFRNSFPRLPEKILAPDFLVPSQNSDHRRNEICKTLYHGLFLLFYSSVSSGVVRIETIMAWLVVVPSYALLICS